MGINGVIANSKLFFKYNHSLCPACSLKPGEVHLQHLPTLQQNHTRPIKATLLVLESELLVANETLKIMAIWQWQLFKIKAESPPPSELMSELPRAPVIHDHSTLWQLCFLLHHRVHDILALVVGVHRGVWMTEHRASKLGFSKEGKGTCEHISGSLTGENITLFAGVLVHSFLLHVHSVGNNLQPFSLAGASDLGSSYEWLAVLGSLSLVEGINLCPPAVVSGSGSLGPAIFEKRSCETFEGDDGWSTWQVDDRWSTISNVT